jgi:hypothetical protein
MVEKFESFRAKCNPNEKGCNMPLHLKAESFKHAMQKDCPVINYKLANKFRNYAEKRGIKDFNLLEECSKYKITKKCKEWENRNKECVEIINNMRLNAIPSLEKTGEFKDLPSISELKLISRLCSNLGKSDLENIAKKLEKNNQKGGSIKIYKFKEL